MRSISAPPFLRERPFQDPVPFTDRGQTDCTHISIHHDLYEVIKPVFSVSIRASSLLFPGLI